MLVGHPRPVQPPIISANPMALATLTCLQRGKTYLVEWTSVRKVKWTRDGSSHIRHVLDPILPEHIGSSIRSIERGLGLNLKKYDIGCRFVVDVSI